MAAIASGESTAVLPLNFSASARSAFLSRSTPAIPIQRAPSRRRTRSLRRRPRSSRVHTRTGLAPPVGASRERTVGAGTRSTRVPAIDSSTVATPAGLSTMRSSSGISTRYALTATPSGASIQARHTPAAADCDAGRRSPRPRSSGGMTVRPPAVSVVRAGTDDSGPPVDVLPPDTIAAAWRRNGANSRASLPDACGPVPTAPTTGGSRRRRPEQDRVGRASLSLERDGAEVEEDERVGGPLGQLTRGWPRRGRACGRAAPGRS